MHTAYVGFVKEEIYILEQNPLVMVIPKPHLKKH